MSSRARIIGNIRESLGRGSLSGQVQERLRQRLGEPEQGIRPAFHHDLAERFTDKLVAVAGTVSRVPGVEDVTGAIRQYLEQCDLPAKLVVSTDRMLDDMAWPDGWQVERRPARGGDRVSVTGAFAAIAETGTLALLSGPDSPTTLNFLPDDHIVVIRSDQIVSHFEDLWQSIRERVGSMPRTVNLITGPSRTADVEQTIQLGAHGPRRLHVVLVDAV